MIPNCQEFNKFNSHHSHIVQCTINAMSGTSLSGGLVHDLPQNLEQALTNSSNIVSLWEKLTPIARNEFICWIENAKRKQTRNKRISRAVEELLACEKRPCCWVGCIHRTDKKPSKWQQNDLINKKKKD